MREGQRDSETVARLWPVEGLGVIFTAILCYLAGSFRVGRYLRANNECVADRDRFVMWMKGDGEGVGSRLPSRWQIRNRRDCIVF